MKCLWEKYNKDLRACKNVGIYLYQTIKGDNREVFTSIKSAYKYLYQQLQIKNQKEGRK